LFELLKAFAQIALLKSGPAVLPKASVLLAAAVAIQLGADLLRLFVGAGLDARILFLLAVSMLFAAFCFALLLQLYKRQARLMQTLTAVFGAGAIVSLADTLIVQPLIAILGGQVELSMLLGLVAWSLVINAHILRCALDVSLAIGAMLALVIFVPQVMLVEALA
jgi:hypothetical protein